MKSAPPTTKDIGSAGESVAEKYLKSKGCRIIEKNFTSRFGEIDMVANRGQHLFFVEVKRRIGSAYGFAIEAVPDSKKRRIRKTAEYFLLKRPEWQKFIPFFSVLTIDEMNTGDVRIEFIPDAFV